MAKKFPKAEEVSDKTPVAWRSSEDIIGLYNDAAAKPAQRISAAVRAWVEQKAVRAGWSRVYFPLAYPNKTLRAGAVFVKAVDPKVWTVRKSKTA